MTNLVIKYPKDCKDLHNKRKKFANKRSILGGITLQGETRDIIGTFKRNGTDKKGTWTPVNIPKIGQEMTGTNRMKDIDVGRKTGTKIKKADTTLAMNHLI